MTQRTKSAVQSNLSSQLPDNTTRQITAAHVRENIADVVDSAPFLNDNNTFTGTNTFNGAVTFSTTATIASSSYATTASYAIATGTVATATNATSASYAATASFFTGTISTTSASYAQTASYFNGAISIDTASFATIAKGANNFTVTGNTNLGNADADLVTVKGTARMGYTTGTPAQDAILAVHDQGYNHDYSLYTKGYNYFDSGDTTFKTHDLYFEPGSSMYVASNLGTPTIVPFADSANVGFAVCRPNNETTQQMILNYQGGAGRLIALEKNAGAPQMRFELFDGSTVDEILRFEKTKILINTTKLPTTEPPNSGQLWLSGSAGSNSKVLCVTN